MTVVRWLESVLLAGLLTACAGPDRATEPAPSPESSIPGRPPRLPTGRPSIELPAAPSPEPERTRRPRRLAGIDVSHHQGAVDWTAVAGDGVRFAYLKATEGSGFSDPRFAENWDGAAGAGLRVGGYHYYTLCSEPAPQAEHFVSTLAAVGPARRTLPPVVDLELIGNCDPSPDPATMATDVESFVDDVERRTGRRVVVYTHPDFDDRYPGLADGLDRKRWVRRPGDVAPPGDWWIWQRSDDGTVAGVDGPVDLDVMRPGPASRG